ncbi:MAG: CinA family protein [Methanomassiliicoccaceae archaeon]|nr:CinA family protein [Methanomassiliicoccaceae archaeon]
MTLAEDLSWILSRNDITLSVAESCTGGMLGSVITSVPGSSRYFLGGAITYGNESKEDLLNVKKATMIENGSVSGKTAVEMAEGARELFGSDVAVSVTGIAGPEGGTAAKPVGLVWIGISSENGSFARKFNFDGSREEIRTSAVNAAIQLLIGTLPV